LIFYNTILLLKKIIISYRKHEIADLNTLAMGDMFKSYHNIATEDKKLTDISEEKNLQTLCH